MNRSKRFSRRILQACLFSAFLVFAGCEEETPSQTEDTDTGSACSSCCDMPDRSSLVASVQGDSCCAAVPTTASEDEATTNDGEVVLAENTQKNDGLKVGDPAPKIEAKNAEGEMFKLADHLGKKTIVVYFYPADFTGGCTKQACGFRDDFEKLAGKGVMVIGVSGDTAKTHALFKKEHGLNFTLLADPKGEIAKAFGVPIKSGNTITRTIAGNTLELTSGVTANRWTFVIGPEGNITHINTKVNAAKDSRNTLSLLDKQSN